MEKLWKEKGREVERKHKAYNVTSASKYTKEHVEKNEKI